MDSSIRCSSSGFDVDFLERVLLKPLQTVKSISPKLRLRCARVFLQTLDAFLACPNDISAWVQLLILHIVFGGTFLPKNKGEHRSDIRERCQFDSISSVVSR